MKDDKNMKGKILAVNISEKKGEKKHDIGECLLLKEFGLVGDAHGGFEKRQVSLLAKESIDKIIAHGIDVGFGDFAENLTTEGMELYTLPIGTELHVGGHVLLRITQIGKVCHDRCAIFKQVGDCVMPREGIFAEVLTGGEIKVGDTIEILRGGDKE
jgi:MOSC domain-containing protein YiiM